MNVNVNVLAVSTGQGTNLFVGTYYSGIFLSTNNGTSWAAVNNGLTDTYISSLIVSGTNLLTGTGSGLFLSTNNGTSWTQINNGLSTNSEVSALAVSGTNLFAGIWDGGVFLSTNNGTNWTDVNTGRTNSTVNAFAVSGTNLFAGTHGDGVWKRSLSDMITGIEDQNKDLPSRFELYQNYPNPFNPSTTIRYSLPKTSFVTLKVYDILGREVGTLVNEQKPAGNYQVEFNASSFASGVYFYKIQAGSFAAVKKLLLLK